MSPFNAHGESLELSKSLLGMMPMAGAQIDYMHCVTILSTSVAGTKVASAIKNYAIIEKIKFELVATIIRQLDKNTMGTSNLNSGSTPIARQVLAATATTVIADTTISGMETKSEAIEIFHRTRRTRTLFVALGTTKNDICLQRTWVRLSINS